jgi:hypothetical protein
LLLEKAYLTEKTRSWSLARAMRGAISNGHYELLQLLLDRRDRNPKKKHFTGEIYALAIGCAVENAQAEIFVFSDSKSNY